MTSRTIQGYTQVHSSTVKIRDRWTYGQGPLTEDQMATSILNDLHPCEGYEWPLGRIPQTNFVATEYYKQIRDQRRDIERDLLNAWAGKKV